ncbi:glycoside hydrolase family 16 protein [Pseudonocardia sp. GCM10023141]|uniref:glycoside hydrolase family 16 protein n=1 Tax=Pseudonocardia sp. GCM10023141 TaxID=3252653 RepID=UPI00360B79D5
MSETQQLSTPTPPPPPVPEGRRRAVLVVLSLASVVALLAIGISVVRGGTPPENTAAAPKPAATGPGNPQHPQGRATLDPSTRNDTEAAVRFNWPMIANDEFDGTALSTAHWQPYSGKTTGGTGQHDPKNLSVADGIFSITSHGTRSGGMSWAPGQMYGRWEVRAKTQVGTGYGAVMLLWPDAEDWPQGGEVDFMEIPKPERKESNFVLHFGDNNDQNGASVPGDFTQWHNYAVEWTPDHIAGFIDGQEIFRTTDKAQLPPRPMHLAIQQDVGPYGDDWIPALDATTPPQVQLQIDWVRIYGV